MNFKLWFITVMSLASFSLSLAMSESSNERLLAHGIRKREINLIEKALADGASADSIDSFSGMPCLWAAVFLSSEYSLVDKDLSLIIIKMLLKAGASINAITNTGKTVLHSAVIWKCNQDAVQLLLDAGIDIHIRDNPGQTVLDIAKENSYEALIQFFQDWQKKLNEKVKKEVVSHLPPVLADIVAGYVV